MKEVLKEKYIQYTLKKKEERERRWRKAIPVFDYSIISNNCWGGFVYQGFRQRYLSPTIGLFMMGKDYVKFCYHLMDYLNDELTFIDQKEARYYHYFKKLDKPVNYPVARLKDIEIYFMHYKDRLEAYEKWSRRKDRINDKKLFFKFSERQDVTYEQIKMFDELPYNKVVFKNIRI